MNRDELLDIIGEARDEYVLDAKSGAKARPRWIKPVGAAAACFVLIAGSVLAYRNLGGNAGTGSNDSNGGSSGGGEGITYMSYAGPVFPLDVLGDAEGISAGREITFDFSPYGSREESCEHDGETHTRTRYDTEAVVTDSYTLTNAADEDMTLTLLYPFSGRLRRDEEEFFPTVSVDGVQVSSRMRPGPYSGGFTGVYGAEDEETGSANLVPLDSFEGYKSLLSDGRYRELALDEFPALGQPVAVYRLSDYVYTQDDTVINPTLQIEFYIDYDKTQVFTYGFNGGKQDIESGYCARDVSAIEYNPNLAPEFQHPDDVYLVIYGEDIESYTVQGYRDGGCEPGEELDDLGCTVTRYETTLGEFILSVLSERDVDFDPSDTRLFYGVIAELLSTYGLLSETPADRYEFGMLEDVFSEAANHSRVIYLEFELTIPAGESVEVSAVLTKDGSHDFFGEGLYREGYDMATRLGSSLSFTSQTAAIVNFDAIEIIRQNFGFDPENGVTTVALDMSVPHYWLEVRKK